MNKVPISELRKRYQQIARCEFSKSIDYPLIFYYFNLSSHFIRDEDEFDHNNYQLLRNFFKKNTFPKENNIYLKKNDYIFSKYINNFKEYRYLQSSKLIFQISYDLFKYFKNFLDLILIIISMSFFTLFNSIKNFFVRVRKYKNIKFYGIYCKRGIYLFEYLYPGIKNEEKSIPFIFSFMQKRFLLFNLILNSLKSRFFISPLRILDIKDFIISLLQLLTLFLHDLFLTTKKGYSFLKFWFTWISITKIFNSILVYNAIIRLVKNSEGCEFIAWYENQMESRSFSLGFAYAKKKFNCSSTLSTFYGSPLVLNSKKQYFPINNEIKLGIWGEKFYLQEKNSKEEMDKYLKKHNISVNTKIVAKSMQRIIKNKFENLISKDKRNVTIFTHDTSWDLIACLLAIYNKDNLNCRTPRKLLNKNYSVFIRLHPYLNKSSILKEIRSIQEIPNYLDYKFIDNREESISDSINKSSYCFFGLSAYINLALKLNANVFSVDTSHLNVAPVKSDYLNSSNLKIINPW